MTTQVTQPAAGPDRRPAGAGVPAGAAGGDGQGMAVLSYLLGGVLVYGALGWLGWHFLGQVWMLPTGIVLGIGLSLVLIVRRYARADIVDAQIKDLVAERDRQREHWSALARQSDPENRGER